jgi:hypothetical protein
MEACHVRFAHTGDAMPIDPALVSGADVLVHDATFLDAEDRKWDIHRPPKPSRWAKPPPPHLVLHHLQSCDRARLPRCGRSRVQLPAVLALDEGHLVNLN